MTTLISKVADARPAVFCVIVFGVCLIARFLEYFGIRTDASPLGENVLHKLFGIAVLAIILTLGARSWKSIGFKANRILSCLGIGLLLGIACYAIAFAVEMGILSAGGSQARLEFYVSGFSLSEGAPQGIGVGAVVFCIVVNIVNVIMEEGVFRGLFITDMMRRHSFAISNAFAALLFGLWHVVMPMRAMVDGEMSAAGVLALGVGYVILSGLMSVKWGLLFKMTGSLWAGAADHFINNAVATNMLHVVSAGSADEMQIVRIIVAQLISLAVVCFAYAFMKRRSLRS